MARGPRGRSFVIDLLRLLALVLVAGGAGVGIGMGLAQLSDGDDELTARVPGAGTTAATTARTATGAARTTTPPPTTRPRPATATPARRPSAQVQLRVLGAVLRPAGTLSGRRRQRARLIMRVRAHNSGKSRVTLGSPILRVGSVRIPLDPGNPPEARFGTLGAGEAESVTLRYELGGDATPKVIRDRRARLDVAGRSLPLRVRVGPPVRTDVSTAP